MKKIITLLLALLLLSSAALPVFAAESSRVTVTEQAQLFSDDEGLALMILGEQLQARDIHYFVMTYPADSSGDYPSDSYVFDICGIEPYAAAVGLVIREVRSGGKSTYYYDLYTYNDAEKMLSDADVDRILDDLSVFSAIKNGRLYEGARAFLILADQAAYEYQRSRPLVAVITGAVVGVIAAVIAIVCVLVSYRRRARGESYPLERYARLSLTAREDRFVGSYVTRVRVQSNSSGGRSGGSGGGRSGGRRGGR
ncbi:MAG: hypothetical protein E7663_04200 [Ruminococcaceae bacterium]|nr:hypothetical protein [Oscillospiraceae bacterium]